MGILFNQVDRSDLSVGDHIYSWRTGYTYAHHGIFVGFEDVIHFTRGSGQEIGAGDSLINSFASSSMPKQHLSCSRYPHSCGLQNGNSGVISSCLNCFLEGGHVHRFQYGVGKRVFFAQVRGTCTFAQSDSPDVVIHRAMYLHQNGFGNYDLFSNNCEDFAIYCKTGFIVNSNASGRSGQAAAAKGVCAASWTAYGNRNMLNSPLGLALYLVGTFCFNRYKADIGVRVDKTKVPVEDLVVYLDSSTRNRVHETKVAVEDSTVHPPPSTRIHVDKTKVRLEDVPVFLDSCTGKKLPVEALPVHLESSTGICVDKTKVPVEESAVCLESSTGIRVDKTKASAEDVTVFLDSSTGKKHSVEDLAACFDSSTGNRVDKAKVPAEGEALFLNSSTVKKPPVAESSTCQAISRNRSSKKQKEKRRQQHRSNSQLVQGVEDVAVFIDSSTGKKPAVEDLTVFLDSSTGKKAAVEDLTVFLDSSTGISVDKTKLPVQEEEVFLDPSAGKKPPVEDLVVYHDSSTGIGVDKTKAPVEDMALFPGSSTGKKPPVAENSASQAISRNRSSKKQKKKLRQQHRRNHDGQTN